MVIQLVKEKSMFYEGRFQREVCFFFFFNLGYYLYHNLVSNKRKRKKRLFPIHLSFSYKTGLNLSYLLMYLCIHVLIFDCIGALLLLVDFL